MAEPVRGILSPHDLDAVRHRFGVDDEQVRRDHVISHALAALSTIDSDSVVFIGGTALSRTHLTELRLSEDIDLIGRGSRTEVAREIQDALVTSLGRAVGVPRFEPDLAVTRHPASSVMSVRGARVKIQLLNGSEYPQWPTEVRDLEQRYADAPPARMRVLTAPAFAAAKLAAWHDRAAPRDLYDLWALAEQGIIDAEAAALFGRFGPLTDAARVTFSRRPSDAEWVAALSHQGVLRVGPVEAADVVRRAWVVAAAS
ncbi:nucleotidyl transferase AbiEii/AbiGii toxin family protein [Microbacterium sp. BWT-B31]|uniref:nucleotidyl transferase AbiEii/AbiGii toxin family protein n=1 Tax=Microbacterium sp. BWT-B31 TaxID=3232072 RepID=UPI003528FBBA